MTALIRVLACLFCFVSFAPLAHSHALEPGYLQLTQVSQDTWRVFWRRPDVNGAPMAIDAGLPDDCQPGQRQYPRFDGQAWSSVWTAECTGGLTGKTISIPGLEAQRTDVLLKLEPMEPGAMLTFRLTPEFPSVVLPLEQSVMQVLLQYGYLGFDHILEGWDHLLFVFALLVLIRDVGRLVGAITAFTVAHSFTLALATLGMISLPGPPVEAVIALSIVFLAIEILKRDEAAPRLSQRFPWVVSFLFGLLHGFGFAGALSEIGLPQGDIPAALFAFNLGVEVGQLTFVVAVLGVFVVVKQLMKSITRRVLEPGSVSQLATGYTIGGIATFWLAERLAGF